MEVKLSSQYPNIILIGGSKGTTMVHLVVARRNDIKAVVALNGGGRFFLDDVLYNIRHTRPKEYVEDALNGFKQFADTIKTIKLMMNDLSANTVNIGGNNFLLSIYLK